MLVQVAIENCLSFREQVVLGMERSKNWEHPESHVRKVGKFELLRCAAMFGANASGKSNFVKAMAMAKALIVEGTRPDKPIRVDPFALDPSFAAKPTRFQFIIAIGRDVYSYGFGVTRERVTEEWLFLERDGHEQPVFERELAADGNETKITLGASPLIPDDRRDFFKFLAQGTRPNQLFLCEARERQAFELLDLIRWFSSVRTIEPHHQPQMLAALLAAPEFREEKKFIETQLRVADTGIESLSVRKVPAVVPDDVRAHLESRPDTYVVGPDRVEFEMDPVTKEIYARQLEFSHRGAKAGALPLASQSDGTRRLLELLPVFGFVGDADQERYLGTLTVIDELDRSLHPLLSRHFIRLFFGGKHPSQMVFTTHDANLLEEDLLVPDEIWFAEKNREGASRLFSLTDFKKEQVEKLRHDLERGYLVGRFGGIPNLHDPVVLHGGKD